MFRNFKQNKRFISVLTKVWSGTQGQNAKCTEEKIIKTLRGRFPKATTINVQDVSGGCGAMFEIEVESHEFKGIPIIKQHRMITDTLKNEIKDMHGLRIHTAAPANGD